MIFTDAARELLKTLEGCKLKAYRDQGKKGGRWTIGYGHTGHDVVEGLVWTQDRAEYVFLEDVDRITSCVEHLLEHGTVQLNDDQFSALVIFTFNEGVTRLAGSTALRDALRGYLDKVPGELMRWVYEHDASGVPIEVEGLVNRRKAECALWNGSQP